MKEKPPQLLWKIEFWDEDKKYWNRMSANDFYTSLERALARVKFEKEDGLRWSERENIYRIVEYSPTRTIVL